MEIMIILVVEHDSAIGLLVEDTLAEAAFKVELVTSARMAVNLLDKPDANYRALITDVNLGRNTPSGWEVARHAPALFPAIPIIYMTSDSAGEWKAQGVPNSVLLAKPFVPAQLITALSHLLNAAPPSAESS